MHVAGIELKFHGGKTVVEPGMPLPEDHRIPTHIFQSLVNQRRILNLDAEEAARLHERWLRGKRDDAEKARQKVVNDIKAQVEQKKHALAAAAEAARKAEHEHEQIVKARQGEEQKLAAELAALDERLSSLYGVQAPVVAAPAAAPNIESAVAQAAEDVEPPAKTTKAAPAAKKSHSKGRR